MNTRTFTALLAMFLLIVCASARAQSATVDMDGGRRHFDRGVEYYRDGNINAALIEFKRAYAAAPNYRVLYNLGQVSNALSDYTGAQSYFEKYLSDGGDEIDAGRRRDVDSALAKLAGRITTITLLCNMDGAELFVDDVVVGKSPLAEPVRVSAGTRRLAAAVSGRPRATRVIEAAGGEALSVRLELEPEAEPGQTLVRARTPNGTVKSGPGASLWLGIATGALAAGAGVMGTLAAIDGSKYHDALHQPATSGQLDSLHDRAATKALATDILLGAAVVAGTITVIVLLTGGHEDRAPRAASASHGARVSLGLGHVQLTSQF
jgi:tetratricopeptide (TPR) repeat protein